MIITCGKCNTSYELDDSLVKATGTQVRCTTCQSVFTAYPEPPAEAAADTGAEAAALPEGSKDRARRQFASSTAADELWRWYERVHDYTFTHFPDPEHGEWYGYLDRDGRPAWTAKANGWKGFFHLPRALFRCYRLLDALADDRAG